MAQLIIFSYFEDLNNWNFMPLVQLWRQEWTKAGFKCHCLGRHLAQKHPKYKVFLKHVDSLPTINPKNYEVACYMRWLAMAHFMEQQRIERALMSDFDVFPRGFNRQHMGSAQIVVHERTRVPCLVEATIQGAANITQMIMSRIPKPGVTHYSDMYAFKETSWPATNHCVQLDDPTWTKAAAVHASHGACLRLQPGKAKIDVIKEIVLGQK
ncbi:hypothetical protein [Thiocapsa sp. N5-Cardenillas]|uniref:hypothetical protein n=1 Tax=Thiocapsa sp. N5-Cardenillas TaxID=3137397 RepID=UPI0035B4E041